MHYFRLLKAPVICFRSGKTHPEAIFTCNVSILFNVVTDLGDTFYPKDVDLQLDVLRLTVAPNVNSNTCARFRNEISLATKIVKYAAYTRACKAELSFHIKGCELEGCVLQLCISRDQPAMYLGVTELTEPQAERPRRTLPALISLRSSPVSIAVAENSPEMRYDKAGSEAVERSFRLYTAERSSVLLRIHELIGERTIEGHIWDAGIGFLALLSSTLYGEKRDVGFQALTQLLDDQKSGRKLNILELGAGTGIAGLALAVACPAARVILTDRPAALPLLADNISLNCASFALGSEAVACPLNWEDEALPPCVRGCLWDLILATDCTYNIDSAEHLVQTLRTATEQCPAVPVVVALKRRHEAEQVFFDKMKGCGFNMREAVGLALPEEGESVSKLDYQSLDVYAFSRGGE